MFCSFVCLLLFPQILIVQLVLTRMLFTGALLNWANDSHQLWLGVFNIPEWISCELIKVVEIKIHCCIQERNGGLWKICTSDTYLSSNHLCVLMFWAFCSAIGFISHGFLSVARSECLLSEGTLPVSLWYSIWTSGGALASCSWEPLSLLMIFCACFLLLLMTEHA